MSYQVIKGIDSTTGKPATVKVTGDDLHTYLKQIASERNPGTANQYGVGVDESTPSVVDVSTNSTDVSTVPALLFGIYINTDIAVEAVGLHDGTGGTELITIPIGAAGEFGIAGTFVKLPGIKFDTAIFVESTNATGSITVCWRAQ